MCDDGSSTIAANNGWLAVPDAAIAAEVSTRTIMRWIASGLPTMKVSGRLYVHLQDLRAWRVARKRSVSYL